MRLTDKARMGSTRLPNKTLELIEGKPLLWHVINRINSCEKIDKTIIATTNNPADNQIEDFAKENNIEVYRGSEEDVLDRFYNAAKKTNASVIVRVTADDPFKDPKVTDYIISQIENNQELDYASNTIEPTFPEGIDMEVFTFKALEKAWIESEEQSEREHVTPYIWKNPSKFKILNITNDKDLSKLRWTIDYPEDVDFTRKVYNKLYKENEIFLMKDILNLLEKYPELKEINGKIEQRTWEKNE